ncbi:MAG: histidine phosphatase family protein [Bacteroidales bacterium]|nr:histidine phosphatase family protein [Bacteroidales bacterium]MBN2821029.1 histidine phosphatase family protein [Bacteroidales bacterium]
MAGVRITIVRHGETVWNKSFQLQGHQDSPLTESGIKQAELLSGTINSRNFDCIVSSDLPRAIKTAEILNKNLKLDITYNSGLRERAFGVMEGLKREVIKEKYPEVYNAYMQRDAEFQIPNGESLVQFNARVIQTFDELNKKYKHKHILVIAHGGVLDCVIRHIFRLKPDDLRCFSVYNTSVNTIKIENSVWILEEWGNMEHMQGAKVLNEFN